MGLFETCRTIKCQLLLYFCWKLCKVQWVASSDFNKKHSRQINFDVILWWVSLLIDIEYILFIIYSFIGNLSDTKYIIKITLRQGSKSRSSFQTVIPLILTMLYIINFDTPYILLHHICISQYITYHIFTKKSQKNI